MKTGVSYPGCDKFSDEGGERLPLPQMSPSPFCPSVDLLFSPDGVAKQFAKLNPYKACGPDNLPARVLKEISQSASAWLVFIFQLSFDLGVVPSDWSKALVTAVFKRENKSDPSNYCPISLTSICCKVMEHIVLSHMAKHLSSNNILINEQHGFRQQFSCETKQISALHDWAKSINSRSQTDVMLLDFSKAFDSVLHQRLLLKLDYYGIRGNMLTVSGSKSFCQIVHNQYTSFTIDIPSSVKHPLQRNP